MENKALSSQRVILSEEKTDSMQKLATNGDRIVAGSLLGGEDRLPGRIHVPHGSP